MAYSLPMQARKLRCSAMLNKHNPFIRTVHLYYQVFNVLMIGADSTYVNSGLQGAQAAPTIALIIILVASLLYQVYVPLMFKAVVGSIRSGSYD